MNLFLYVEIAAQVPYVYQNSKLQEVKSHFSEIILYDCDNHSESLIIQAAVDLLKTADKAFVWIHANGGELGKIRLIVEKIIQPFGQVRVFYTGFQVTLDRLLQILPPENLIRGEKEDLPFSWVEEFYR